MGTTIGLVALDSADIGSLLRHKEDKIKAIEPDVSVVDFKKKIRSESLPNCQISLDENGEYNFSDLSLGANESAVYYDGVNKIAEISHRDGKLEINAYTEKQINLFSDITAEKCVINTKGPLCVDGKLRMTNALSVTAEAAYFTDSITCDGQVAFAIKQGLGLLGDVQTENLAVDASYYSQQGNVKVSKLFDLATQALDLSKNSETTTSNLRLLAEQAEICGELCVQENTFLAANRLKLGSKEAQTTLKLFGQNHIHAKSCMLEGDTQVNIHNNDKNDAGDFMVDDDLTISSDSILDTKNIVLDACEVLNSGECTLHNTVCDIDELKQQGLFDANSSTMKIYNNFRQKEGAESNIEKTVFMANNLRMFGGDFILTDSEYKINNGHVLSGEFQSANNSEMYVDGSLIFDPSVTLKILESQLEVMEVLRLGGPTTLEKSKISAADVMGFDSLLRVNASEIKARQKLVLDKDICGADLNVSSQELRLSGNHTIDGLQARARHLTFNSDEAELSKCITDSKWLTINGSKEKNKVMFKDSTLVGHIINQSGHVVLDTSRLVGIDDEANHSVDGNFKFKNSRFITEGQIHNSDAAKIKLKHYSSLSAKRLVNDKKIKAKDSNVFVDSLLQSDASLSVQNGSVNVERISASRKSNIKITERASFFSEDFIHDGRVRLKEGSLLNARKKIVLSRNNQLKSKNSAIASPIFATLGSAELSKSILSTDELRIYDKFVAKDCSQLRASNQTTIGERADVKLDASSLASGDITSFGKTEASDSVLNAETDVILYSPSETTLTGSSVVRAKKATVYNKVVTKTNEVETEDGRKHKTIPHIVADEELSIKLAGVIQGEDLKIDAGKVEQTGTIDLEDSLQAKGGEFHNTGNVKAKKSMYFGFDDAVINSGCFSSDAITVHSNFFNLLGLVDAKKRFASSGFMSLNFGMIAANNYTNDSLFSLNSGLCMPNLTADPSDIFSRSNFTSFSKTLLTTALPGYSKAINLAYMLPGVYDSAKNLYELAEKYDWQKIKTMRRHEIMPLACQVKGAGLMLYNAGGTAKGAFSEVQNMGSDIAAFKTTVCDPNFVLMDSIKSTAEKTDWCQLGLETASVFAGNHTDNSLVHFNLGANLSFNTNKSNLLHVNTGVERSLLSHTIDTYLLYNAGSSGGANSSFSSDIIYNSGNMDSLNNLSIKANKMKNAESGCVTGGKANIDLAELTQSGYMKLQNGRAKIDKFTDGVSGNTELSNMYTSGQTFDLYGKMDARNVVLDYEDYVHTHSDSNLFTQDVRVTTNDFSHYGELHYENILDVEAETATLGKGSVINGEQTAEEELFTLKEENEPNDNANFDLPKADNVSSEPNIEEPEKEFAPQHVFKLSAKKVTLAGKQRGGDYTVIQGNNKSDVDDNDEQSDEKENKCEELIIEEFADVDLKRGTIDGKAVKTDGKIKLEEFHVNLDTNTVGTNGDLSVDKSSYKGQSLESDGTIRFNEVQAKIDSISFSSQAKETIKDSLIEGEKINDDSQLTYSGKVFFQSDEYRHGGHVFHDKSGDVVDEEEKDLFYVKANKAELCGSADIGNGYYDIKHFADVESFVVGLDSYEAYKFNESFAYETEDIFATNQAIRRDCDVTVKADSIYYDANYDFNRNLSFISTKGDVNVSQDVSANNFYINSAKNAYTSGNIYTEGLAHFDVAETYYNLGGTINGETVAISAAEIKNVTRDSKLGKKLGGKKHGHDIGYGGIINGRKDVFLDARNGNIENHGGVIRAGDYAQLTATGDVLNLCNIKTHKGKYDKIKEFDPGLISGGNGTETDGFGLYIKAGGKVISDASAFVSNGHNYIEGVQGVDFKARYNTYISKDEKKSKYCGFKKKHVIETKTNVYGSVVHSNGGCNVVRSGEGEVNSVATRFSSPGGTDVYAKGDVNLYSLKTQDRRYESKSSFFGLNKSKRKEIHDNATPTLFIDNGFTRVHSAEGNVDARGAYFIGDGDLEIKAGKRIKFGVDILDHEIYEESRSFGVSAPGLSGAKTLANGGSLWDALTAEDATLAKINSLSGSSTTTEFLTNASNLGIDLYNTTNSAMRGIANDDLGAEALARYGLGGADGFCPTFGLSYTQSKSKSHYQTQSSGGVDRGGNVKLEAGEGVDLENGVKVHADGNMEVDAPEVIAHAAKLDSSFEQKSTGANVSFTPTGQVTDAGVSYSHTKSKSTTYSYAELSAGNNMHLHHKNGSMKTVELDGANINSKTLDADIEKLIIRDKQDENEIETTSASASMSGQVSGYHGKGKSKVTNKHAGIHVQDGFNTDDHTVKIHEAHMEGGAITTDGVNDFTADKLVCTQLKDEEKYVGAGASYNINDFSRLTGDQKPTNEAGEQAIATATLTVDYKNYEAVQTPVIHGAEGTNLNVGEIDGKVHTTTADGCNVVKDKEEHLSIDVPLTNQEYLQQSQKNIRDGANKVAEAFSSEELEVPEAVEMVVLEQDNSMLEDDMMEKPKEEIKLEDEKVEVEIELSEEMLKEVINNALEDLTFESPEQEQSYLDALSSATKELEETGVVSDTTLKTLEERIMQAIVSTMKAGSEAGWGKIIELMGPEYKDSIIKLLSNPETVEHGLVKAYVTKNGILVTFALNVVLASPNADNVTEALKDAGVNTAGDMVFGFLLKKTAGAGAGPIGWIYTGLGIIDSLCYDQIFVDGLFESGIEGMNHSRDLYRDGKYWEGWNAQQLAFEEIEIASKEQAGHILLNLPTYIGGGIKHCWNSFFSGTNSCADQKTANNTNADDLAKQGIFAVKQQESTDEQQTTDSTPQPQMSP